MNVTSVSPDPLILGYGDLTINYTIYPTSGFTAASAKLEIRDKNNTAVYKVNNISKTGGAHDHNWSGKWNQSPHSGKYVDPQKSSYTAKVTISKDDSESESSKDGDVEARALSGSCVLGYSDNAQDVADEISDTGYDVAVYSNISKNQATQNTEEQLVWYCLCKGTHEGVKGRWVMRFNQIVLPGDFQSGLDYKLIFPNCCYSLEASSPWSEYKSKFGADTIVGWEKPVLAGVAAAFGEKFFKYLKNGDSVSVALGKAEDDVGGAGASDPGHKGNGNLKIVFPLD